MRPHTAKCVRAWCTDPRSGRIKVTNSKVFGAVVYSQIKPISYPVVAEYRADLTEMVEVELTVRYEKNKAIDWRRWTMHIDRPSMLRIDKWVNDLFVMIIYQHYVGNGRKGKTEVIREYLQRFDIGENELMFNSIYDAIRRVEREEIEKDRWPLINSLS